jgi:hypothetical protein
MPAGPGNFPTINGLDYGYSSVRLKAQGVPFPLTGVKDFSYKGTLKPGEGRGTNAQVTSTTTGQYNADGALTLYKAHFAAFWAQIATLAAAQGLGPMQVRFDLTAAYSEVSIGSPGLTVDNVRQCRIIEHSDQHAEEDGVLVTKVNLHILQVDPAGIVPFTGALLV